MSSLITDFTSLPNLHPLLVHFPVALLPTAVLLDLAMLVARRSREWLDRSAAVLYLGAALGAAAAYWAGRVAADGLPPLALPVQLHVNEHSDSARAALWLLGLLTLGRLAASFWDPGVRKTVWRWLLVVAALGSVALVARTADLGGGLVFQHGVGVAASRDHGASPLSRAEVDEPEPGPAETAYLDRLDVRADGSLAWRPLPGDRQALGGILRPAPETGSEAVSWAAPTADGLTGLGLRIDGEALLVLPGSASDVEVSATLEATGFEGELGLAHRVRSGSEYGLLVVSLPLSEFALKSRDGGEVTVLDSAVRALPAGAFQLRVTAAGRHFHGFLADERVVHGHGASPAPGGYGLYVRGKGVLRLLALQVTPGGS